MSNPVPRKFTPAIRALIDVRSEGMCEACGRARATQVHHRLYLSRGGRGNAANGLAVCGLGGADGCHIEAHTLKGELRGWSIRSGGDPLVEPEVGS